MDVEDFIRRGLNAHRAVDQLLGYSLVREGDRTGIRCQTCGFTSWHPEDVRQKYCGNCHVFHDEAR